MLLLNQNGLVEFDFITTFVKESVLILKYEIGSARTTRT